MGNAPLGTILPHPNCLRLASLSASAAAHILSATDTSLDYAMRDSTELWLWLQLASGEAPDNQPTIQESEDLYSLLRRGTGVDLRELAMMSILTSAEERTQKLLQVLQLYDLLGHGSYRVLDLTRLSSVVHTSSARATPPASATSNAI